MHLQIHQKLKEIFLILELNSKHTSASFYKTKHGTCTKEPDIRFFCQDDSYPLSIKRIISNLAKIYCFLKTEVTKLPVPGYHTDDQIATGVHCIEQVQH
jgi:hypothetical protein